MTRSVLLGRLTVAFALLSAGILPFAATATAGEVHRNHVWDLTFPVEEGHGNYRQGWHDCRDGCARAHRAVDIYATPGTPVYAAAGGVIAWRRTSSGGGWSPTSGSGYALYIDEPEGKFRHFYGHFGPDKPGREDEAFAVNPETGRIWQVGDTVQRGQHLGYLGTSGATASGPHVHFELRSLRDGIPVDDPGDDAMDDRNYGDPDATPGSFAYLRYDPFYSLRAAEARRDYSSGAAALPPPLAAGDYVTVSGVRRALTVRGPGACDDAVGSKPDGTFGRILEGPARCPDRTNYDMWRVRWADCSVGWASARFLQPADAPDAFCPDAE